jgi:hypothetical protein
MAPILIAQKISKRFGTVRLFDDISVSVYDSGATPASFLPFPIGAVC